MHGLRMNMIEQPEIPRCEAGGILCIGATASKKIGGWLARAKLFRLGAWNVGREFRPAAGRWLCVRCGRSRLHGIRPGAAAVHERIVVERMLRDPERTVQFAGLSSHASARSWPRKCDGVICQPCTCRDITTMR